MTVGIGLLGCGVVGSAVMRALEAHSGCLEVRAVAVRDPGKPRDCRLPAGMPTPDPFSVIARPDVDVVVEAIGGMEPATTLISAALDLGKPVVTANKAVLAWHGPHLRERAAAAGAPLLFEAAVGGAVPVIRGLSGLLQADEIIKVEGVLNGTSTFVLSHMEDTGATLPEALAEARRLGLAEPDASRDLDGRDAADKLTVLAQYLFGDALRASDVQRLGIDVLTHEDIVGDPGRRWRLLATAARGEPPIVEPAALPHDHPFAKLSGPQNAITVTGARAGAITLIGPGAGGDATACSVVADLLAAHDWLTGRFLAAAAS